MPKRPDRRASTISEVRVVVSLDNYEGNAVCGQACPEVFKLDEEIDQVSVVEPNPGEHLRAKVEEAVRGCPKTAIRIED